MKLQRIRAVARKEWWHLLRDPRSLAMILLMPSMLLFLFGYAIRLDISDVPLGVLQQSTDPVANDLVARFDASKAFKVVARFGSRRELAQALQDGTVAAAMVISSDFSKDLERGTAQLQLIVDGTDANSARIARNYAQALVNDYLIQTGTFKPTLEIRDRIWFNESRESRVAIIPGVIAVVMAVIGALMTSLTVAREMEQGNLVMLRTTALTTGEFLVGKLSPYFVIGMGDLAAAALSAVYLFDVPLRGSAFALSIVSALFLLVVMLQGVIISIAAGNQILASQMALVATFLPAFLLSGFIFAIENMPLVLQYLTLVVPARYYVLLSKVIFLKGVTPLLLWTDVVALCMILFVLTLIAAKGARKLGLL